MASSDLAATIVRRRRHYRVAAIGLGTLAIVAIVGCGASGTTTVIEKTVTASNASVPTSQPAATPPPLTSRSARTRAASISHSAPSPASTSQSAATAEQPVETAARPEVASVVGQTLNVAENNLDSQAIGYSTVGGGVFGIVIKADWTVCEETPRSAHEITLFVARSC